MPIGGEGEVVDIEIHLRERASPALAWHLEDLVQLPSSFMPARPVRKRLRARQYPYAVHETGARVTHDVKNLLQSLEALIGAGVPGRDAQVRAGGAPASGDLPGLVTDLSS